jgi:5-methyltetrahydrofolate--homocysteine methyltransferase
MPFLDAAELDRRLHRHEAWHRHELTDGPLVLMTGPEESPAAKSPPVPEDQPPSADDQDALRTWWTDPARVIPRAERHFESHVYYADAFPFHNINLGPGGLAAYMGCHSVLRPDTIWQEPLIDNWSTAPELRLHEDSFYWQATQSLTRTSVSAARGRWVTGLADIGGVLDITSYFRTPEKLCLDLLEHPAEVRLSEEAVLKAWFEVYDRLAPLLLAGSGGTAAWMGLWYPGRNYPLQCDFSAMISPKMFCEFALPMLQRQAAGLDVTVYHLDGLNAVRHLEAICTIPNCRAIQWVPGTGHKEGVADWLDLYQRILELGRSIIMVCREEELDLVFNKLDPDRIAFWTGAANTKGRDRILSKLDRLRRQRKRAQ